MDGERFDLVVRSVFVSRSRRTVMGVALGGFVAGFGLQDGGAKKKRRKKKRKKRPSCGACADNEECVDRRCVDLARICGVEDDLCTTGATFRCGAASDAPEERGICLLTQGGNPICARDRATRCRPCTSHADCERQGWGPRGVCLAKGTGCCGESGPALCSVPYGEPCRAPGEPCAQNADCCSERCAGGICRLSGFVCVDTHMPCVVSSDCCNGSCKTTQNGRVCTACVPLVGECEATTDCCQAESTCAETCGKNRCCQDLGQPCDPSTGCSCCLDAAAICGTGCGGTICCRIEGFDCEADCDCCGEMTCQGGTCGSSERREQPAR